MNKIALGSAQFGMNYGVSNSGGQIKPEVAFRILDEARDSGVDTLDTAAAYGNSESVIGQYLQNNPNTRFRIITKYSGKNGLDPIHELEQSRKRLCTDVVDGYLFHSYEEFHRNPGLWQSMAELKIRGQVRKAGFSVYHPAEITSLLDSGIIPDMLQFPLNIFDQRFLPLLPILKCHGVEIHIRSVFLQGLFFLEPVSLPPVFSPVREKLLDLRLLSKETGISLSALALGFASAHEGVDRIIIGVENPEQFRNNLTEMGRAREILPLLSKLEKMREDNENIILPSRWK